MINWGIIGCGDVTELKSGPAFNLIENSNVLGVTRRNVEKARDYAQRHGIEKVYNNATELINDPGINAVYIATPPDTHASYAIEALNAKKPVYVEKPMGRNYEECRLVLDTSKKNNTPVYVAYYRRALPGFLKVKELLDSKVIGNIKMVKIELYKNIPVDDKNNLPWRVIPEIAGGGHFVDLASHQLDYLDFVLGPVRVLNSSVHNQAGWYKAEDTVSAQFTFEGNENIVGNGIWNFSSHSSADKDVMVFIGDKGFVKFSAFDFRPVELHTDNGKERFEFEKPQHVQQPLIEQLVPAIINKSDDFVSTGVSGARTNKVMDEILHSYYYNK